MDCVFAWNIYGHVFLVILFPSNFKPEFKVPVLSVNKNS